MMDCVDEKFEMDCPQFVDFTVPQDMDDNADEWFNFDHERGVRLTLPEIEHHTSVDASKSQPPQDAEVGPAQSIHHQVCEAGEDANRMSVGEDAPSSSEPEACEMLTDSLENKPTVHVLAVPRENKASEVADAQAKSSESEDARVASQSEIASSSASEAENKQRRIKTRGSPEVPVRSRRLRNIVTSFAPRSDESFANSSPSETDEQKKSEPRHQKSVQAIVKPMRKSPRLQSRRSADSTRSKRNSISHSANRRSANASFSRPRSRASSTDQPINKKRKMGHDGATVSNPANAKKPCPKLKSKIHVTIPNTPTLFKRNIAKPAAQVKSTEEMEMEKIAQFRNELAAIRKKSAQSHKAVKESAPVMPAHGLIQSTKTEEFKFETDTRLKSHPMETRKDAKSKDFVGNLRKYVPSPSKPLGPTKPKPFNLSDSRKRTHEESFAGEKKGYEFRPTALAINQFQTKTPDRFRSRPLSEQNKGPEPCKDKPKKRMLTQPVTPFLESRNRQRPVTAISQAEKEEQEVAEMKNYKFRARPVDPRVMSNIGLGVKTTSHKELTKPVGFDLEVEKRIQEREANRIHTEERYEFRARPLPAKIFSGPVGIAEAKSAPVTQPKSPAFALKERAKAYEDRERKKAKEPESLDSHIFKAKPILHVGVPFVPNILHKRTETEPFSFDDKIQETAARKEAKKQEILEDEEKARQFRAQPLPDFSSARLPEKKVKPPTQVAPFSVADKGAKQADDWSKKLEEEIRESRRVANSFKAKPANILYEEPFIPEKSTKPMTDISNFTLNTERRAEERKDFEQKKHERQCALDATIAQREAERDEELRQEISRLRAEAVHRANPIRHYTTVEIQPSLKPLTQPSSPKFSDRTRKTSQV